ncbi:formate dehydrogenase subunit gamma [Ideonella sp. DXS22W]|uniref:Formate dehydrogenase subunit gamma n=1 Tax=Pseudaquabacterium inlustre TaxID=2984192 RepID=A0ABU9CLE7_9BURK
MRQATLGLGLVLALAGTAGAQPAAAGAVASAPAAVAAPEPKPDDTNAQRAKSQPGNNAPFWRAVRESGQQQGYTSLPGAEKGTLIQSFVQYPGSRLTTAGEAWRQVRNQWIIPYGGSLLLIAVLALAIFYKTKGPLGGHHADTGRKIERFTPFERAAHWANAGAFVALAVSGIVMAFGKFFLLPVIGSTLFGWLTFLLKNVHNFVGPLFAVSLLIVIVTFIKDNIANSADFVWLKRAGGMLGGGGEVPSHRFNAGEKGMFWWGVTVPGIVIVASGLVLDKLVPGFGELRGEMQIAHMVHAVAAMVMMTALIGHIYMGTIGVKGALGAMKTGWVDEGWAKEHHELWYDDVKAGKIPAQRSGQPAPGGVASPVARA